MSQNTKHCIADLDIKFQVQGPALQPHHGHVQQVEVITIQQPVKHDHGHSVQHGKYYFWCFTWQPGD